MNIDMKQDRDPNNTPPWLQERRLKTEDLTQMRAHQHDEAASQHVEAASQANLDGNFLPTLRRQHTMAEAVQSARWLSFQRLTMLYPVPSVCLLPKEQPTTWQHP
jgi:hypothetical protein